MKRRALCLTAMAAGLFGPVTQPRPARAQSVARVHLVAVLGPDRSDETSAEWRTFVAELARRGLVEGRNLRFERRYAENDNPAELERLAAELARLKPDLIYAARGTLSALAAKRATQTIPIVFFSSADPVGLGLVASLAKPGGNITGNSVLGFNTAPKGLQILAEATGKLKHVAFLQQKGTRELPWFAAFEHSLKTAAAALGSSLQFVDVVALDEIDSVVAALVRQGVDGAMVPDFPLFRPELERIAALCVKHRLPTHGYARAGFLLHYSEPRLALARDAAAYVDKILKGARPADLPVQQLTHFEFVINLKTAHALGLTIPSAVLLRADEVIE